MPFLDALRAVASVLILGHHFAIYPPFCEQVVPILGGWVRWFHDYARLTQVFFVVGGYVMARGMSGKTWKGKAFWIFFMHRYCRLGIPYLGAVLLAIFACAIGRGILPDFVVGGIPTWRQCLAHLCFLQDVLGFEAFSAGIWFVCINFQLGLLYSGLLVLRDIVPGSGGPKPPPVWKDASMLAGWVLAAASLFFFNLDDRWDCTALYFFPHFFMGIVVHRSLRDLRPWRMLFLYQILMAAGLAYEWRGRLVSAVVVGLLLFAADRFGWSTRWPKSRVIARLGMMSYSLFLVHFPVLVMVSSLWGVMCWDSPWSGVGGLWVAFVASLGVAMVFYRFVEQPAAALSRRWVVPRG